MLAQHDDFRVLAVCDFLQCHEDDRTGVIDRAALVYSAIGQPERINANAPLPFPYDAGLKRFHREFGR